MSDPTTTQPQTAFDELARITLADHSLESVMGKIAELTKTTVPGADDVSVTMIENGRPRTIACTGAVAATLDERQYESGYGPCLASVEGGEPVRIDDLGTDGRWPDWAVKAKEQGVGSTLSLPVPIQREVTAAINIYSTQEQAFDDAAVELALTFAAYAAVALANMHLYQAQGRVAAQLQEAMQSRAVIEQAKGILMGQRRCSADEAFNLMVRLSQQSNRKLREVADALVQDVTGGSSGG